MKRLPNVKNSVTLFEETVTDNIDTVLKNVIKNKSALLLRKIDGDFHEFEINLIK